MILFALMGKVKIDIDRRSGRSLTDQLVDGLRAAVRLGRWKEGERLPTREELMATCGVSRNVVQAAVRRLVAEGLVITRPRLGCIVARSSRRPMRGVVLEIDTGSGIPYWNASFAAAFRKALSDARINCRVVGLSYDRNDKMCSFDQERLEYELAQRPDLVLVKSSQSRTARLQRLLDGHDIPYVMVTRPASGRHRQMLWGGFSESSIDYSGFVADCVRAKVRSVMWLAYTGKTGLNPCEALGKAGIAVEKMLSWKESMGYNLELEQFMAAGRDCMLERLKKGPLCDLLFVADDYLAMGAIAALLESGVRIPEDVRLVTYYNKGFGPILTKTLARIEGDPEASARECVRGIVEWFKTDRFPELNLPQAVYVRGETFPVPAGLRGTEVAHKDRGPML